MSMTVGRNYTSNKFTSSVQQFTHLSTSGNLEQFSTSIVEEWYSKSVAFRTAIEYLLTFVCKVEQTAYRTNIVVAMNLGEIKWQRKKILLTCKVFAQKTRARPGFEPGTSRTQSENHAPRPTSHR